MTAFQRIRDIETSAHDERSVRDIPFLLKAFRVMEALSKQCWQCKRNIPHQDCRNIADEFEHAMESRKFVFDDKY